MTEVQAVTCATLSQVGDTERKVRSGQSEVWSMKYGWCFIAERNLACTD